MVERIKDTVELMENRFELAGWRIIELEADDDENTETVETVELKEVLH